MSVKSKPSTTCHALASKSSETMGQSLTDGALAQLRGLGDLRPELGEQLPLVGEHVGQDAAGGAEQVGELWSGQRVDHGAAFADGAHDARPAQDRELLGEAGRLDVDLGQELPDGQWPFLE